MRYLAAAGFCISVPGDWNTLYNASPNPSRNASNSWGNATYSYGGTSYNADNVMWTRQDYLIVVAAGNSGPTRQIAQPGNAKNILSVGAPGNHRPALGWYADTASALTYFSAGRWPPAATPASSPTSSLPAPTSSPPHQPGGRQQRGRLGQRAGDGDGDGRPDYAWSSGTSMSTPLVTGAATVARQYFQDIQGLGNTTPQRRADQGRAGQRRGGYGLRL